MNKQSTEVAPQTQLQGLLRVFLHTITGRNKFLKYCIAAAIAFICAAAFFSPALFEKQSPGVTIAEGNWLEDKGQRTFFLNKVKEYSFASVDGTLTQGNKDSIAYFVSQYRYFKDKTNTSFAVLNHELSEQYFFKFPTKQQFFGEFWAFGLLLYVIFNITRLLREAGPKQYLLIHGALLYSSLFYIGYLFIETKNPEDFSPIQYLIGLAVVASLLITGSYCAVWIREKKIKHYIETIRSLFSFLYTETDEKGYIKEDLVSDHKLRRHQLTNKAVGND